MTSEDEIRTAIRMTVARTIVEGLNQEHRDALIADAMCRALKDYAFTSEIGRVVGARAAEVAAELCRTEEWTGRIEAAIRDGFEQYLSSLRDAMARDIVVTMHGEGGCVRSPARILGRWPGPKQE